MSRLTRRSALQAGVATATGMLLMRDLPGALAASAPSTSPAASLDLPAAVRAALAANAAAISPITLRWTTRARSMTEIEELARSMNPDARRADRITNEHRHYRVTFQDGKYRASHREEPAEPREVPPLHESAFDGEFLYGGTLAPPLDGMIQTSYLKYPLAAQPADADENRYFSTEVFDAMGIRLPVRIKEMKSKSPVRSEILHMLEAGGRLSGVDDVELDGRKLTRLRILADDQERRFGQPGPSKRLFVFHLDPALNLAIRRREEFCEPDAPLARVDLEGHEKLADRDLFVPRRIVSQFYGGKPVAPGKAAPPVQTRTTEVTQIDGNAKPAATFTPAYNAPGTRVYINDDKGRQTGYIVQEDGTLRRAGGAR